MLNTITKCKAKLKFLRNKEHNKFL